jgi:hypothetical protein
MVVFGDAAPGDWCEEIGDIWKAEWTALPGGMKLG